MITSNRFVGCLVLCAAMFGVPAFSQWLKYPTRGIPRMPNGRPDMYAAAPRTVDGKPDLTGIWRHMELQTTFDDRRAYSRAWTVQIEVELVPDTEILEYVCNENEQDLQHFVRTDGDQANVRADVKVTPETLSKYVGVYESLIPGGKLTYEVSLNDKQLMIRPPMGGGRIQFLAASDTNFFRPNVGDSVEFVSDKDGRVTHFIYRSPEEGERTAIRRSSP